jgi:hypothetical protein
LPGGASGLKYVVSAMGHMLKPIIVGCVRVQAMIVTKCLTMVTGSSS